MNNQFPHKNVQFLSRRAFFLRNVRSFFDARGFIEVQTPCLTADALAERFVEPLIIRDDSLPCETMYLHTSPELAMKRLLIAGVDAGLDAIYQIAPVFRRGDRGRLHNVEFTMLEYYCTDAHTGTSNHAAYQQAMQFLSAFVAAILGRGDAQQITYQELFRREVGIDPLAIPEHRLRRVADSLGIIYPQSLRDDKELWLDIIFSEVIQPKLGLTHPVIVCDFPLWQSQLAVCDGGVAQRFELFVDGIELANGYRELTDSVAYRTRLEQVNIQRAFDGRNAIEQPHFQNVIAAAKLPASTGCAVGLDRLFMVATGATNIDEVIPFPIETC